MSTGPSPTGPSDAHKTPVNATRMNTPGAPQDPAPPETTIENSYPSPQTFDILPPLHTLLIRLLSTPPYAQQAAAANTDIASVPNESALLATSSGDTTAIHSLDSRALATGVSAVKIRIQKARSAVEELPDIQRSVGEQEEELEFLERRIARLKGIIQDFGKRSSGSTNGT